MSQRKKKRAARRRAFWFALTAVLLSGAVFVIGTGRWLVVYAFFAQFHQQALWAGFLLLFVPLLLVAFVRGWGVEDIPYVEEVPELGSGRLRQLEQRIRRSRKSEYDQALLINELSELATEVIALNEGIDVAAARRLCRSGEWNENQMILDLIVSRRMQEPEAPQFVKQFDQTLTTIERMLKGGTDIESRPSR